jgi:hypothetical protein
MKKLTIIFLLIILAGPTWAFQPEEWMNYSTTYTADQLIDTGAGYFYGFVCQTDASNAVTFKIYDALSATGTRIGPDMICSTSASNRTCVFGTGLGVPYSTGLYIDITLAAGTTSYQIFYREK